MDSITIALIVATAINTLLHGYHLKRSSCVMNKQGVNLHVTVEKDKSTDKIDVLEIAKLKS